MRNICYLETNCWLERIWRSCPSSTSHCYIHYIIIVSNLHICITPLITDWRGYVTLIQFVHIPSAFTWYTTSYIVAILHIYNAPLTIRQKYKTNLHESFPDGCTGYRQCMLEGDKLQRQTYNICIMPSWLLTTSHVTVFSINWKL